ncbi:hypothetical protein [Burkholderia sp. AU45388]|uniref:hypothetical protein n=1 Tax=Burkholderia sp. AU45388 TaxID=3059206 RepID=UPI0026565B78|nr:hypothetical protein [Burkholderia sp. AU45388]MDN7431575.1 hypothetical protein [Burkholderia sp. AU45388]
MRSILGGAYSLSVQWLERRCRQMLALGGFGRRERDGTYGGIVAPKWLVLLFVLGGVGKMDIVFPPWSAERRDVLAGFFGNVDGTVAARKCQNAASTRPLTDDWQWSWICGYRCASSRVHVVRTAHWQRRSGRFSAMELPESFELGSPYIGVRVGPIRDFVGEAYHEV